MNISVIDFFYDSFSSEKMNFLYTGDFSDELTDQLIGLNNYHFEDGDDFKKSQRKAAFLIAECFQNIVRHNDITNINSYFHIKNSNGIFNIISGNTIQNNVIPTLKVQLEQLNKLTTTELKDMYRKTLAEGNFSNKGGAGLGLIEMARKTKNKLSFSFSEINEDTSYFYFQLQNKPSENFEDKSNLEFNTNISLRDKMLEENLILVYKGKISNQITNELLGIIEKAIKSTAQKVVFLRLMNFYEKASINNIFSFEANTSMLFISDSEDEFGIATSCLLDNQKASGWVETIKQYKALSKLMLESEYNALSQQEHLSVENKFKLYLIELLKSCSSLYFDTRPYSDEFMITTLRLSFLKDRKEQKMISEIEYDYQG